MEMMTNVAPVLNIRTITDKDEVIVDVYISCSEPGKNYVLNAGCAVLALKTGSNLLQIVRYSGTAVRNGCNHHILIVAFEGCRCVESLSCTLIVLFCTA